MTEIIKDKAPASLRLAFWAIAIEATVGIGAGVLSAIRKYSTSDKVTTLLAAIISATPVFVLAFIIQQITGVYANQHDWPEWAQFPVQGIGPEPVVRCSSSRAPTSSSTWSNPPSSWRPSRPSSWPA